MRNSRSVICPNCSMKNGKNAKYCYNCGLSLAKHNIGENKQVPKSVAPLIKETEHSTTDSEQNKSDRSSTEIDWRKAHWNVWTILAILVEWILSFMVISMIAQAADPYSDISVFNPLVLAGFAGLEYLRQKWLIKQDNEESNKASMFGASNFGHDEDIIDRNTFDSVCIPTAKEPIQKNIRLEMDGHESDYAGEQVYYFKDNVVAYLLIKREGQDGYLTQNGVTISIPENDSIKWEKVAVGKLYITNNYVFFYSYIESEMRLNFFPISLDYLYYLKGHADLGNIYDCIKIRTNDSNPRDIYFHAGDKNGTAMLDDSIGKEFYHVLRDVMVKRGNISEYMGTSK